MGKRSDKTALRLLLLLTIVYILIGCTALPSVPTPTPTSARSTNAPKFTPVPPTARLGSYPVTKSLGPVRETEGGELFTAQIAINKIDWVSNSESAKAAPGNVYLVVSVHIRNAGPGTIYSLSAADFRVKDANGVMHDAAPVSPAKDCELKLVNLIKNKVTDGCVAFEVPETGSIELIYAPFHLEELAPKRYLAFPIRH